MKMFDVVVRKSTVLLCVVWCSLVFALPPKKVFITTGAVEHGVQSGAAKPLFSIGLGPFSLQLGVQQWGQLPIGQMPQAGTGPTNITLPSLTVLVPNAVLNVSGLQQPGAQPPVVWVIPVPNGGGIMPTPIPPNGGSGTLPPGTTQPVPMPWPPLQVPWEMTTTVVVPGQQPGGGGGDGGGSGGSGGGGGGGGFIITETTDSMGNVVQTITPVGQQPEPQTGQTIVVPGPMVVEEVIFNPSAPIQQGLIRRGVITRLAGGVLQRNNTNPIINFIKGQ